MHRRGGTCHDEFGTSRRRYQDVGLSQRPALSRAVLRPHRNTVEPDDRERLSATVVNQLQVENRVGGGIRHAPELLLTLLDLDHAGNEAGLRARHVRDGHVVQRQVPRRHRPARVGITRNGLVPEDQQTLRQSGHGRLHAGDAADDDRS